MRDLTLIGDDRPMDVFDAAKRLFIHQYELTVHQRLSQAFAMGDIHSAGFRTGHTGHVPRGLHKKGPPQK